MAISRNEIGASANPSEKPKKNFGLSLFSRTPEVPHLEGRKMPTGEEYEKVLYDTRVNSAVRVQVTSPDEILVSPVVPGRKNGVEARIYRKEEINKLPIYTEPITHDVLVTFKYTDSRGGLGSRQKELVRA